MTDEYQVLRVKPKDLETAINDSARAGWDIHSIIPAQHAGSGYGFFFIARGAFDVSYYHLILHRQR